MQACAKYWKHAIKNIRETHTPALFHVEEITQPQGILLPAAMNVIKHMKGLPGKSNGIV